MDNPPAHRFIVFSTINDDGTVNQKYSQCNNCGVIHKITDICTSEIIANKDHMNSIIRIEDIKPSLHPNFVGILESSGADIATWEAVQFIVENKKWGEFVVLTSEVEGDDIHGKYIRVLGESFCKVESFSRSTGILQ
jgi:hypothetical protein